MTAANDRELREIAERMAQNRGAADFGALVRATAQSPRAQNPNRRGGVAPTPMPEAERQRRRHAWWAHRCEMLAEEVRPHVPPTEWSFITKLTAHLKKARAERKSEANAVGYNDVEARDWRAFASWHRLLTHDTGRVIDVLDEYRELEHPTPEDTLLLQGVTDAAEAAKDKYRLWQEQKRILWLPRQYAHKQRDGERIPCTVVDYLAAALVQSTPRQAGLGL